MIDQPASIPNYRHHWSILAGLIIINLAIHLPFLLTDIFGEPDAARLAVASIQAAHQVSDPIYLNRESLYSAPLYVEALRFGLMAHLITTSNIPGWMTYISFLSSAIVTALLYLFVLNITGSVLAAAGTGIILQFNPTFWFNSIYGFPTLVAIAFLLISLITFQIGLREIKTGTRIIWMLASFVFFVFAILTKIDAILAGAIYCLPLWQSNRPLRWKILSTCVLFALSLACYFLYAQYVRALLSSPSTTAFYINWNLKFPIEWRTLFSITNIEILLRATGLLSIPLAVIAVMLVVREPKYRTILFWLAAAAIPLMLFWGVRANNSARHNLIPGIFFAILLSLPLSTSYWKKWGAVLIIVILINYFVFPPLDNTVAPSGRLIASSNLHRQSYSNLHHQGQTISNIPEGKIFIIGKGSSHPFYAFELLRNRSLTLIKVMHSPDRSYSKWSLIQENQRKIYLFSYLSPPASEVIQMADLGYFILIEEPSIEAQLKAIPRLQNRWLPLSNIK